MSAVFDEESFANLSTLLEALANLAADAVTRLHNPLATCRGPTIQALYNMLHAVTLVELAR